MSTDQIKRIILDVRHSKGCAWWQKILIRDYSEVYNYILNEPRFKNLEFKINFITMCNWILNDRFNFPICKNPSCGKKILKNLNLFDNYLDHCSVKCSQLNPTIRQKIESTCIKKYGASCVFLNKNIKDKIRDKMIEKFGVQTPFESSEIQMKARRTLIENYGVMNPLQSEIIRERAMKTTFDHFGVSCSWEAKEVIEKSVAKNIENFGVENVSRSPEIKKKKEETCIRNFGVKYPIQSPEIYYQIQRTNIERYGYTNPMQNDNVLKKSRSKYLFGGMNFDSIPELAFFIWLNDNNEKFQYKPPVSFQYLFEGTVHKYHPDFIVNGEFIEIKGDQFFDESGKMICPFKKRGWTEQKYLSQCKKYEAKHQCMIEHNVKILTSDQYIKYVKYVNDRYGKTYLKSFKRR